VTALEVLAEGAFRILGRSLTDLERGNFNKYLDLLIKWQKVHRLIGSTEPMWIVEHLFLDSLIFLRLLPSSVRTLVDVGSGAGFPGLPLKIVKPEVEVVLIESRRRRAMFLASAIREMKLTNVHILEGRLESFAADLQQRVDAVVMRCAGDVQSMIPAAAAITTTGGIVIASGPPKPRPLLLGEWVAVQGVKLGSTRRFAVYRPTGSDSDSPPRSTLERRRN
jgi:16S rRNA (guanine527-N7)-methyltransferase